MKTPLSWLNHYVATPAEPADVAKRLTFSGIELEGMESIGIHADGIIVAEVRAVEKHPQADKLSICRVFDGQSEKQVVCGAPNVTAGGKYPFAPVGSVLKNGELKIKKAKLRGVESFGMLCSAAELDLSSDHSGLMTLAPDAVPGTPMKEMAEPPDTIFELEITPNRPDCLCMIGVARELAALYGTSLTLPAFDLIETGPDVLAEACVSVDSTEDCPRYTARVLHNVTIGPAPGWMKERLEKAGIRSINNVVDITNYVMLETGHPLHAFDLRLIEGRAIHVRRALPGETMATLDGIERKLDPTMLVIADNVRPIALAGVMGGAGSEIQTDTTSVLLESAIFNPAVVRPASRKLMLFTDSSYRFERGVNPATVEWASRRAAQLLVELAGATVCQGVIDTAPEPAPLHEIYLRTDRVRSLLGLEITNQRIIDILRSIELIITNPDESVLHVIIPSFRFDLEREVDLIEEVARLHGLDSIKPVPSAAAPNPDADDTPVRRVSALRQACISLGLQEIVTYSLTSASVMDLFSRDDAPVRIDLPRPVTADQSVLRTSLTPQLVETLGRNRARQIPQAALFEIGTVYVKDTNPETGSDAYQETRRLGIGLMGRPQHGTMLQRKPPDRAELFGWLKGLWERIAEIYRITPWSIEPEHRPFFEPGYGFTLTINGTPAGWLGLIAPAIRKEWRITDPAAVLELDLVHLLHRPSPSVTFQPVPAYPSTARDVAILAPTGLAHATILDAMRRAAPPELEQIQLFDIFEGGASGPDRRSLAYTLVYRSANRTLTDDEVNGYHEGVKKTIKQELNIEIRES